MNTPPECVTSYAFPAYPLPMVVRRGRPPTPGKSPKYPNRIGDLRVEAGLSREMLAERSDMDPEVLAKLERGQTKLKLDQARRLGATLAVPVDAFDIASDITARTVPVKGYVGAGTEVFPIDDYPVGQGPRRVRAPAGLDADRSVAVEVRGDSMFPLGEGAILFYRRLAEGVPFEAVGQMCIVKLAGDGPMLVKNVRRGYTRGRYNLLSSNAPPREDVALEWAAPVLAILSPDLAEG